MIQDIEKFINESSDSIEKWKISKNEIIKKTKILKENKISLESLNNYLKDNNEFSSSLKNINEKINEEDAKIKKELINLKIEEDKLNNIKIQCLDIFKLLLKFYNKLLIETDLKFKNHNIITESIYISNNTLTDISNNTIKDIDSNDVLSSIEMSKILLDKIDNFESNNDIYKLYKDINGINKINDTKNNETTYINKIENIIILLILIFFAVLMFLIILRSISDIF